MADASLIEKAERLRALHVPGKPLVLPNAWDPGSAKVIAAEGFPAIATTSAGVAFSLGYPDARAERMLLEGQDRRDMLGALGASMAARELLELQQAVRKIHVAGPLLDYVQAIVAHTRQAPDFVSGLSPRSGLNLLQAARAA